MKRAIALILILALMLPVMAASATDSLNVRVVVGADLTDEQINQVYASFGRTRGSVTELIMTNEMEHGYLDGSVDASVIGTRSVSCVYVEKRAAGTGLEVSTTKNITYFTPEMYISVLTTAGITDARIIIDAPFEVSGTGALAGIYYAYENLTGKTLGELQTAASSQELTVTGDLASAIGSADAEDIVSDVKDVLGQTADMTDEELKSFLQAICTQYNVSLSDEQINELISLCRSLESLDEAGLLEKVTEMQGTIGKVSDAATGIMGFFRAVKNVISAISDFFTKIKTVFGK